MREILCRPAIGSKLIKEMLPLSDTLAMVPTCHLTKDLAESFTTALAFGLTRPRLDDKESPRSLDSWQQILLACVRAAELEHLDVDVWAHAVEVTFLTDHCPAGGFKLEQLPPGYFARLLKCSFHHGVTGQCRDSQVGIADVLLMKGCVHCCYAFGEFEITLVASVVTTDHRFASVHVVFDMCNDIWYSRVQLDTQLPFLLPSHDDLKLCKVEQDHRVHIPLEPIRDIFPDEPWKFSFPLMRKARDSLLYGYAEFIDWYGSDLGSARWNEAEVWSKDNERLVKILRKVGHVQNCARDILRPDVLGASRVSDPVFNDEVRAQSLVQSDDVQEGSGMLEEQMATEYPEKLEDREMSEIVELSVQEAIEHQGALIAEALLHSKADAMSADNVVFLRLTRCSHEIMEKLLQSPELQNLVARVQAAGCEVQPHWSRGALLLVPLTQDQISEAGLDLQPHNIVALAEEQDLIKQALHTVPHKRRPKLRADYQADGNTFAATDPANATDLSQSPKERSYVVPGNVLPGNGDVLHPQGADCEECQTELVVERTFLSYRVPKIVSEVSSSSVLRSAPCGLHDSSQPKNHRCWKL